MKVVNLTYWKTKLDLAKNDLCSSRRVEKAKWAHRDLSERVTKGWHDGTEMGSQGKLKQWYWNGLLHKVETVVLKWAVVESWNSGTELGCHGSLRSQISRFMNIEALLFQRFRGTCSFYLNSVDGSHRFLRTSAHVCQTPQQRAQSLSWNFLTE